MAITIRPYTEHVLTNRDKYREIVYDNRLFFDEPFTYTTDWEDLSYEGKTFGRIHEASRNLQMLAYE